MKAFETSPNVSLVVKHDTTEAKRLVQAGDFKAAIVLPKNASADLRHKTRQLISTVSIIFGLPAEVDSTLLPVIDDFDRAGKAFTDKNDKELEGFFLIHSKLKKVLDQAGVKIMDVNAGSEFDADLHEAITQIPAPDDTLKGKVVDVIEPGYLLNDKVIRFAKVVVGS